MMLLAIDVGNSHTVSGVFKGEKLLYHWRIKTDRKKTADELAARFHTLFTMKGLAFKDINAVVIASVVPTQQKAWIEFTRDVGWQILSLDESINTGTKILIDHPKEVGADRIANTVAAFSKYQTALIIVDFGTATTFDCVSKNGDYLGGSIAPGLIISLDALAGQTAKLPRVDLSSPPNNPIGTNTIDAIKSGMLYGYGGLVDGLIKKLSQQFGQYRPKVIATGGMSDLIYPYTECIEVQEPMLTLIGLRIIYERNN